MKDLAGIQQVSRRWRPTYRFQLTFSPLLLYCTKIFMNGFLSRLSDDGEHVHTGVYSMGTPDVPKRNFHPH